jgi:hypothetical protein
MSRARDLAALVTPNLFNQDDTRSQVGLGTTDIGAKIQVSGAVSATSYYGDGSNLTGIVLPSDSDQTFDSLNITGIATINQLSVGSTVDNLTLNHTTLTGITTIGGTLSVGNSEGNHGQYVISTGIGVTWIDPIQIRTDQEFTATPGQTLFTFDHDPAGLDVFKNGLKLADSAYNSDGGTVVTLTSGASGGDIIHLVGYGVSANSGTFGSLTVKNGGTVKGNLGGIKVVDFVGEDIVVTGAGVSAKVTIPPRQGFIDTSDTRLSIKYSNVGGGTTNFPFTGIATGINNRNTTDVFVDGVKIKPENIDYSSSSFVQIPAVSAGSTVEVFTYPETARVSIGDTLDATGIVRLQSSIGEDVSTKPFDVYYYGSSGTGSRKLKDGTEYNSSFGDVIIVTGADSTDHYEIFGINDGSRLGISTSTATAGQTVFTTPSTFTASNVDVFINGIRLRDEDYTVSGASQITLTAGAYADDHVQIFEYTPWARTGVTTITAGAGQTEFTVGASSAATDNDVYISGIRLSSAEFNVIGLGNTIQLTSGTLLNEVVTVVGFATTARTGLATNYSNSSFVPGHQNLIPVANSAGALEVFENGVLLNDADYTPDSDGYTADNEFRILITAAFSVSEHVEVVQYNHLGNQRARTSTSITPFDGQSVFPFLYTTDLVDVFRNGFKVISHDYNSASQTEIDFLNYTLSSTDHLELISYTPIRFTDFIKVENGLYNLATGVGIGTESIDYQLTVGSVGSSGTSLYVNGDVTTTGVVNVGTGTTIESGAIHVGSGVSVTDSGFFVGSNTFNSSGLNLATGVVTASSFDGTISTATNANVATVALGFTGDGSINTSGAITASSFTGNLTGNVTGTATTATTATTLASNSSVNTSGIITAASVTATTFTGNLTGNVTGTATTATTATSLPGDININTTGIIGASAISATSGFVGNLTGTASNASEATVALGFTGDGSINTSGVITATSFTGDLTGNVTGNVTGTADAATTATTLASNSSVNTSGIITATSFTGDLTGNVTGNLTGRADVATVALGFTGDGSINTSGVITATSFTGDLTGTASTATLAIGFATDSSINTSGIITAASFTGDLTGNVTGTASTATLALGFTGDGSINTSGIITAFSITAGSFIGTATEATVALGFTGDGSINTSGIITAASFTGDLTGNVTGNVTGTASTATLALGFTGDGSINTSGIITAASFTGDLTGNVTGTASTATLAIGFATDSSINTVGIITAESFVSNGDVTLVGDNNILGIGTGYSVGIGSTQPQQELDVIGTIRATSFVHSDGRLFASDVAQVAIALTEDASVNTTGIITAASFTGSGVGLTDLQASQLTGALPSLDGSALTGVVGSGSGVIIQDDATNVGTAGTVNFGNNIAASFSNGTATVSVTNFVTSVNFLDNIEANFGNSSDGRITYTNSDDTFSVKVPGGTGDLVLGAGPEVRITNEDGTIDRAVFTGAGVSVTGGGTFTGIVTASSLELQSTDQFLIVTRMTTAQRDGVASTTAGSIVFNTTTNKHQGYDGSSWNDLY